MLRLNGTGTFEVYEAQAGGYRPPVAGSPVAGLADTEFRIEVSAADGLCHYRVGDVDYGTAAPRATLPNGSLLTHVSIVATAEGAEATPSRLCNPPPPTTTAAATTSGSSVPSGATLGSTSTAPQGDAGTQVDTQQMEQGEDEPASSSTALIAGLVAGGSLCIALIAVAVLCTSRRRAGRRATPPYRGPTSPSQSGSRRASTRMRQTRHSQQFRDTGTQYVALPAAPQ